MLICNAADNEAPCWLYSGELPNTSQKNWLHFIFAGQRHLKEYESKAGAKYYKINHDALEKISQYYKGKIYLYKDDMPHGSEALIKSIEDCVRKYGTRMAVIDNLTTVALGGTTEDKWTKQEEFISALITFAKKMNIAIILVVHPRKIECVRKLTNLDLQGTQAIGALAHRVISVHKVSKEEKQGTRNKWHEEETDGCLYDVMLNITKDRMRGTQDEGTGFYYDAPSRRFYTDLESLDKKYSWDKNEYTTPLPFPPQRELLEREILGEVKNESAL
jgi:hypothetical protein